jgi:hypothetical protein
MDFRDDDTANVVPIASQKFVFRGVWRPTERFAPISIIQVTGETDRLELDRHALIIQEFIHRTVERLKKCGHPLDCVPCFILQPEVFLSVDISPFNKCFVPWIASDSFRVVNSVRKGSQDTHETLAVSPPDVLNNINALDEPVVRFIEIL